MRWPWSKRDTTMSSMTMRSGEKRGGAAGSTDEFREIKGTEDGRHSPDEPGAQTPSLLPQPFPEEALPYMLQQEKSLTQIHSRQCQKWLAHSFLLNIILTALLGVCLYRVLNADITYFAATPDFRIMELTPLEQPYISEAGLMNWAANTITETFTLNFNDYRNVLARVRTNYSAKAFQDLESSIKATIETIIDRRLFMYAVAPDSPRLLNKGVLNGRYSWRIEIPLVVSLQSGERVQSAHWHVIVVASRTSVAVKPKGVEIVQIVAEQVIEQRNK